MRDKGHHAFILPSHLILPTAEETASLFYYFLSTLSFSLQHSLSNAVIVTCSNQVALFILLVGWNQGSSGAHDKYEV